MGQLSSDMDMINLRPFFKNGTFFVKKFFSYFENTEKNVILLKKFQSVVLFFFFRFYKRLCMYMAEPRMVTSFAYGQEK